MYKRQAVLRQHPRRFGGRGPVGRSSLVSGRFGVTISVVGATDGRVVSMACCGKGRKPDFALIFTTCPLEHYGLLLDRQSLIPLRRRLRQLTRCSSAPAEHEGAAGTVPACPGDGRIGRGGARRGPPVPPLLLFKQALQRSLIPISTCRPPFPCLQRHYARRTHRH